ncbi:MAG1360 family OppF-related protein [Mycoplasmopsis sturni]|uniref:MAG1360 family OppF-related protein n=1 Tax=Mycoplasmopsis sturni TaxID=39047 RepID=UPI00055D6A80|nr:hypothetical protein [Mycoplasmopsis sturni]
MEHQRLLLTIENFFYESKKNGENRFLNIPKLNIYNKVPTAFYINPKYNSGFYELFWEGFTNNKSNIALTMFSQTEKNPFEYTLSYNPVISKDIDYLKITTITDNYDNNLPIYTIWKDCLKEYSDSENYKEEIKKLFNEEKFNSRIPLYNALIQKSENIIALNSNYLKALKICRRELKNNKSKMTSTRVIQIIDEFTDFLYNKIQNQQLDNFLDIVQVLENKYKSFVKNEHPSNLLIQKELIKQSEIKLKFVNQINKTSINKVYNDIKVRDLNTEIQFYKDYLNGLHDQSTSYVNSIILRIKKEIKTSKKQLKNNKLSYFDKDKIQQNIFYNSKILGCWKKNKKYIRYASIDNIRNLDQSLYSDKMFFKINFHKKLSQLNLLAKSLVSLQIKRDFDEKAKKLWEESRQKKISITRRINKNEAAISAMSKNSYKQVITVENNLERQKLQETIKLAEAEVQWILYSENRLYQNVMKTKNNQIKKLIEILKVVDKESRSFFNFFEKYIDEIGIGDIVRKSNPYLYLRSFFTQFQSIELFNKFAIMLAEFLIDKNGLSTKMIDYFAACIRFVRALNYLSVNREKLFEPFSNLANLDRVKFKLIKYYLNKTKLIFIEDSNNIISYKVKSDFLRVFKNMANDNEISYVLLTNDLEFIKENFYQVHIMFHNTSIEGGKFDTLSKRPVHPLLKSILENSVQAYKIPKQNLSYIYNDIIDIDKKENHYIYASFKEFQKWTNRFYKNKINDFEDDLPQDWETFNQKRQEYIKDNFVSYWETKEIILTDYNIQANVFNTEIPKDFEHNADDPLHSEEVQELLF